MKNESILSKLNDLQPFDFSTFRMPTALAGCPLIISQQWECRIWMLVELMCFSDIKKSNKKQPLSYKKWYLFCMFRIYLLNYKKWLEGGLLQSEVSSSFCTFFPINKIKTIQNVSFHYDILFVIFVTVVCFCLRVLRYIRESAELKHLIKRKKRNQTRCPE